MDRRRPYRRFQSQPPKRRRWWPWLLAAGTLVALPVAFYWPWPEDAHQPPVPVEVPPPPALVEPPPPVPVPIAQQPAAPPAGEPMPVPEPAPSPEPEPPPEPVKAKDETRPVFQEEKADKEQYARNFFEEGRKAESEGRLTAARAAYYNAFTVYPGTSVAPQAQAAYQRLSTVPLPQVAPSPLK